MQLKNIYHASLCMHGVRGGLLHVNDEEMLFCTNSLSLPDNLRRLRLPYGDIQRVERAPFHTVKVFLRDGKSYRLLVFSRKKLLQHLQMVLNVKA